MSVAACRGPTYLKRVCLCVITVCCAMCARLPQVRPTRPLVTRLPQQRHWWWWWWLWGWLWRPRWCWSDGCCCRWARWRRLLQVWTDRTLGVILPKRLNHEHEHNTVARSCTLKACSCHLHHDITLYTVNLFEGWDLTGPICSVLGVFTCCKYSSYIPQHRMPLALVKSTAGDNQVDVLLRPGHTLSLGRQDAARNGVLPPALAAFISRCGQARRCCVLDDTHLPAINFY